MPALTNHHASKIVKMLLIGDSGKGKTGALASLADAGYNLRILDLDNGSDILFNLLTHRDTKYKNGGADRVVFRTLTEPMRNLAGKVFPAKALVWTETMKMLTEWQEPPLPDGTPGLNLGKLSEWTDRDVLVIDSLTALSNAAYNFQRSMNGRLSAEESGNMWRQDIGGAQKLIEKFLALVTDVSIKCHVIVISHVVYVSDDNAPAMEGERAPQTGYPSTIGKALSPKVSRDFNSVLQCATMGSGPATRHVILTHSQGVIGGKTSAPLKVKKQYPLDTGLADYFKDLLA